jgi:hypothetical protein
MVLHAPSVWEPFGFAQDKLRSLPALIKAVERNLDGLFLLGDVARAPAAFDSLIRVIH